MLQANNIKIMLFTILCICFILFLFMGIYSYKKDNKSKVNIIFLAICISVSLRAIGYALMLVSPNMGIANIWRIISILGLCFFNGLWISFAFIMKDTGPQKLGLKIQSLVYITSIIFFINNSLYEPSTVISGEAYGFVDNLNATTIGSVSSIYVAVLFIVGLVIIYFKMKNSQKNRVRIQMETILITCLINFCLAVILSIIFPPLGMISGSVVTLIGMFGMWYAIDRHKMMSISYEIVSEYLFEAVNEPILILGEDFLVKDFNNACLNLTGYNNKDLEQNSLNQLINFKDFDFNTIMQSGNVINIEVDLHRKNKKALVCELAATVIYDEYKDILGILILLHDVSERKSIVEIQKKYSLELEETNFKLKNEIKERLLAENQIRHYVYYDTLTELLNRKKMREDIDILLDNKNVKFAFFFIDLDKFKSANDNYGHQAGDYILKIVAVRLKSIISPIDTVYRIGGDEFIIIMRNLKVIADAEKMAVAIGETLSAAFIYNENQLFIGASIGISIFPEHGLDQDTLSTKADLAMYEAKRKSENGYKVYCGESISNG